MPVPRPLILYKALRQLGLGPLALNALYRVGVRTGHYRRVEDRLLKQLETDSQPTRMPVLFALPEPDTLLRVIGEEGRAALLAEAEEILAGNVRLFGAEPVPLVLKPDVLRLHWAQYEINPSLLGAGTDLKFIWEPARFGWAYTLGRAWHLTRDDRFAQGFWNCFDGFSAANPAYHGPHWMNGQEVAIRLMALVWAAQVMATAPSSTPGRMSALMYSLAQHAARLPHTLVYARSQNNNHLVTEAAGLYTAGRALGNPGWQALGWRWLNWALQKQISGYGEYIQHSTNYHRLMLQAALWVDSIREETWPHASMQSLERASHFLFSLLDPVSGHAPNLGPNDGAHILPLSTGVHADFRPTVQAAARAFLKTQMPSGPWDETSLWLGLAPAPRTYEPEHYLSDNLRGHESWGYLRASRFPSRLGHMDQLHLDLWWRGLNIAMDGGTYLYSAPPPWDNPLVSTRVHNTVTVDGRDQMRRGGRFLVLDWFPAWSRMSVDSNPSVLQKVMAWHNGYPGIRHERTVTVRSGDRWLIEDTLTPRGSAPHLFRLHWLLPDWDMDVREGPRSKIRLNSPFGWITISLGADARTSRRGVSSPRLTLARAGELVHGRGEVLPWEGWVSPTYGVKIPALSTALEINSDRPVTFTTEFIFPT